MNMNINFKHLSSHKQPGKSKAQALLEFALALPVLLILIFGIIDFALLFQAWLSVENITRQTIRYAVTGEYDQSFCAGASVLGNNTSPYYDPNYDGTADCAGSSYQAEQDYARLGSIHQLSTTWQVAIFKNNAAAQSEKGYLHMTICSNHDSDQISPPDFTWTVPEMASSIYAQCRIGGAPVENAGEPGDNVFIFVDFNHPLITPFLSQVWPMVHLVSYRQGVVETFRTSRSIAQVGQGLQTPLPATDTFTPLPPTETFTSSPTFTLTPIPPTLTPTKTSTATNTSSPTLTPTFSCTQFTIGNFTRTTTGGKPSARITVTNGSTQNTSISSLSFTWTSYDGANPGQTLNTIVFNGITLVTVNDPNSPTAWSGSSAFNSGTSPQFQFNFTNVDAAWPGIVPANSFGLSVTMANGCVLTKAAVPFNTPTPSNTPTASKTSTITLTPSKTPIPSKTPTNTPVTPSNTPTKTSTVTPVTPSNTPTKTPIVPTNTPFVPTKTKTPVPPTWTPVTPIG